MPAIEANGQVINRNYTKLWKVKLFTLKHLRTFLIENIMMGRKFGCDSCKKKERRVNTQRRLCLANLARNKNAPECVTSIMERPRGTRDALHKTCHSFHYSSWNQDVYPNRCMWNRIEWGDVLTKIGTSIKVSSMTLRPLWTVFWY